MPNYKNKEESNLEQHSSEILKELETIKTEIKTLETKLNNISDMNNIKETNNKSDKTKEGFDQKILKIVNNIYKKSFKVLWLSISIIIIAILSIFMTWIPYMGFWIAISFWIVCAGLGILVFVINIMNAVKILTTDFKNEEVNNSKIIWGIFTIVILGWIASLIFAINARNKLNNNEE